MLIQNVAVDSRSGSRVGLGCEHQGQRYHVWLDPATRDVGEWLYKNAPLNARPGDPAHYWTRKLRVDSKFSRRLIALMLAVMDGEGLLEKFYARERTATEQAATEQARAITEERVRQAAPEMLALLRNVAHFDVQHHESLRQAAAELLVKIDYPLIEIMVTTTTGAAHAGQ